MTLKIVRVENRNEYSMGGFVYFLMANGETVGGMFSNIDGCKEYAISHNLTNYTIVERRYM